MRKQTTSSMSTGQAGQQQEDPVLQELAFLYSRCLELEQEDLEGMVLISAADRRLSSINKAMITVASLMALKKLGIEKPQIPGAKTLEEYCQDLGITTEGIGQKLEAIISQNRYQS